MSLLKLIDDTSSHSRSIAMLAMEANKSIEVVTEIFLSELARLKDGARVKDFLVVLACRNVRDTLRGNHALIGP